MPGTHTLSPARSRPRQQRECSTAAASRAAVAAAHPLAIPHLDLPLTLTVERWKASDDDVSTPRGLWSQQITRFMRSGAIKPDDDAKTSLEFIETAAARAFPPAPVLKECKVCAKYAFEARVVASECDPECTGGDDWRDIGVKGKTWLLIYVRQHRWCAIGKLFLHLEKKHPGFGRWLCIALDSPFCISPRHYIAWVSNQHWYGEDDEDMAKEEEGEDWEGLTRAKFDEQVPKWAQHMATCTRAEHRYFLKLAHLTFGVDCRALFDARRKPILKGHDIGPLGCHMGAHYRPLAFGWCDNDMVQDAIDYAFENAMQGSGASEVTAMIKADNLPRAAEQLGTAWRVISIYDELAGAFYNYRKKFKIA